MNPLEGRLANHEFFSMVELVILDADFFAFGLFGFGLTSALGFIIGFRLDIVVVDIVAGVNSTIRKEEVYLIV